MLVAQTTLEQARAANKKPQEESALRSKLLAPKIDSIQFWGDELTQAMESNAFLLRVWRARCHGLRKLYLDMKFLIEERRGVLARARSPIVQKPGRGGALGPGAPHPAGFIGRFFEPGAGQEAADEGHAGASVTRGFPSRSVSSRNSRRCLWSCGPTSRTQPKWR